MRTLLTMLLAAAALSAVASQAQTVDICDRTPQVRDAILEALGAADCAAVEGLANVARLDLSESQLTALRAGDFDGLASLEALYLYDNELTALPEGAFDGLTSLQILSLGDSSSPCWLDKCNELTALPPSVFDGRAVKWL